MCLEKTQCLCVTASGGDTSARPHQTGLLQHSREETLFIHASAANLHRQQPADAVHKRQPANQVCSIRKERCRDDFFFKADKDDAVIMFFLQMLPVRQFQSETYI